MSRAGVPRALVALGVVASLVWLVSCSQNLKIAADPQAQDVLAAIAPDRDTVSIVFKCATVDSVGLFDTSGRPAWNVIRHPNQTITWIVAQTVTINSLKGKSGPLPLAVDQNQNGQTPGNPFKATVNPNAGTPGNGDKSYSYELDVTCTSGPNSTRLVIDPEMIIRKP
jgi:hypothetical protein